MEDGADLDLGLAGAVGPVPFASVDDAVEFAMGRRGRFPTVPVTTSADASLLAQAVDGLTGSSILDGRLQIVGTLPDDGEAAERAADLTGAPFAALRRTAVRLLGPDGRSSTAVRVPVLGPVTLAASLQAAGVAPSAAGRLATAAVSARAAAVLRALQVRDRDDGSPPRVVAVVLSEPALVGSMHPSFHLHPGDVRSLLDPVVDAIDRATAPGTGLIGVHVPGPCDWATVVAAGPSLLCVPVDRSIVGWSWLLGDLLERGGRICWGAVRVDRPIGSSPDPHWRRLIGLWTALVADGVDPMLLRLRSSFAPADGLQRFTPTQAAMVMDLTEAVAERVRRQAVAARLSLGA